MRELVEELCSDRCNGRKTGTPGGDHARQLVLRALRDAGLDPFEQPIPEAGGANVLATIPGTVDRYVMVAAHFDHLGSATIRTPGGPVTATYRGADDNAAAVAILVELAKRFAVDRPEGRGLMLVSFDAEEPPHFQNHTMGSERFARQPSVPLEKIELMICLELLGHTLGNASLPDDVRNTVFALGAERSTATASYVDRIATAEPGVVLRRADAEIIPPLSDYAAFWARERPWMLLTSGRTRRYHTPNDTVEHLDFAKMASTARWLERFVRSQCLRDEEIRFLRARDDVATLESISAILTPLAERSSSARVGLQAAHELRGDCRADRSLDPDRLDDLESLIAAVESAFA